MRRPKISIFYLYFFKVLNMPCWGILYYLLITAVEYHSCLLCQSWLSRSLENILAIPLTGSGYVRICTMSNSKWSLSLTMNYHWGKNIDLSPSLFTVKMLKQCLLLLTFFPSKFKTWIIMQMYNLKCSLEYEKLYFCVHHLSICTPRVLEISWL